MPSIDPHSLRILLGQNLTYQGQPYRVIDILEEGPALVLQEYSGRKTIQANQHGEASRWAPQTVTVAILNIRRDALNPMLPEIADWLS
ncbi:MAG: hypothetical protein V2J55_22155 [Candidatus Competibacteraceae bacterium]|jgi:hypothetical protein|nr:hypothetical protein [Candidatus Competibacteraceae bacterium]